jgi:hypothetical protein
MKIDSKDLERIVADRKSKVDPFVKEIITSCLILNIPFQDIYYIEERAREVLTEAMSRVNFYNEEMHNLRKKLLRKNLGELMEKLPKQKKFDAAKDSTEARNARCETLVFESIQKFIEADMVLGENAVIDKALEEQQSHALYLQVFGYLQTFFNLMHLSMEANYDIADRKKWKGKFKHERTFQDIDRELKDK